jgi:hypothetical protein
MPDFTVKYKGKTGDFSWAIAGLLRQLAYDVTGTGSDETTNGYGISLSAKWQLGDNDIRASFTTGTGIGRYLGLNTFNGAVIDGNGELTAIDVSGMTLAYRHIWDDKFRSNLIYSYGAADNDPVLTGNATKSTQRVAVNLMYQAEQRLTFGAEFSKAMREVENGADGDLTRLQFMAMYSF